MTASLWRLLSHLPRRRRVQLYLLIVLMLAGAAAELLSLAAVVPFVTVLANASGSASQPAVRTFLEFTGVDADSLPFAISMVFSVLVVAAATVRLTLLWASARFCYGWGHDLSSELYRKTLHRPYSFHISRNSSEIIGAIGKVQVVISSYINPVLNGLIATILATAIIGTLMAIDPVTAIGGAAVFGGCYFLIASLVRQRLRGLGLIFAKTNDQRIQAVQEGLGGIRDVILDRAQAAYQQRFSTFDDQYRRAQARSEFLNGSPRVMIEAVGMLLLAGFALAYSSNKASLGALLPVLGALALGVQRLMPLLQQVYRGWSAMVNAQASLDDVLKLIEYEPPKLLEGEQLEFAAAITLRGVSFCYGRAGSATVLHDINLDIRRGERIGIVGPTGSGKSTLVDLLMGLLFPAGGQLRVDGAEITPQNAAAWQRHIAHVPQTIFLTDASLMENIAFAVAPGRIDRSRVEAAAQAAQIHNHIVSLPEGYQTRAGERGVKLSGGQRQRIGIARALYRQADVLVLDEATSALDDVTEERVMRGIDAIARDVTVIVIAHRLSTLKGCDRILQLERGRLVAVSTYQQLMQQRAGIGREEEVGR
jgi:ABC-type multidrug transport system fused ATPase/permease subunit